MRVLQEPTDSHLRELYEWLKAEEIATGEGFFCNWNTIKNSSLKGTLYIAELNSRAVALLVKWQFSNKFGIDILTVEPCHRGKGIGRLLVMSLINEAQRESAETIAIQCMPKSSELFWKSLGFTEAPDNLCERINGLPIRDLNLELRLFTGGL